MSQRMRARALAIVVALLLASLLLTGCCYCTSGRRHRPFTWPRVRVGQVVPQVGGLT